MANPPTPTTPAGEFPARWADIVTGRYGLYTLAINIGVFLWAMNNLVVAGIMPTVVADIGGLRLYSWTFALFSVGSVVGAASAGPLRETFGPRTAYAGAGTIFGIGLAGAALAPNMETLVAMRLLQGLGGGAVSSLGYAMMTSLYPERLRGRILAFTSTSWGVATALGPGFGGLFAEFGLWRGAFWGMTPLVLVFIVLVYKLMPASGGSDRPGGEFPYGRLALIAASVLALSSASQTDLLSARIALAALALALVVAMFRFDARAHHPMFPRATLHLRSETGALYWIMALNSAVVVTYTTFQTLHLQVLHGVTPVVAAYLFMLSSLCWSTTAVVAATWRGRMETFGILLGCVTLLAGTCGLAWTVVSGPVWAIAVSIGLCGSGIGFMTNLLIQRSIRSVSADEERTVGASVQAIRTMGVAFGAAAVGLVAVAGGLNESASADSVAHAMQWVYSYDVALALASLLIALGTIVAYRRRA